jgi:hypothetical protein
MARWSHGRLVRQIQRLLRSKWVYPTAAVLVQLFIIPQPMFLGFLVALGVSARPPFCWWLPESRSSHRSPIAFAARSSLAHASVMAVQTVEAWKHGIHRDFKDVVLSGLIGGSCSGAVTARTRHWGDRRTLNTRQSSRTTNSKYQIPKVVLRLYALRGAPSTRRRNGR